MRCEKLKLRPNDGHISTQPIAKLLAQHLQTLANDRNISAQHIGTLLGATCCVRFCHHVATCCDMLGIENLTSAGGNTVARTRPNDYNNTQRPQMLDEKFDQFSNLNQQYSTCRNTSQHIATGWTNVHNMFILRPTILRYIALNVAIVSPSRATNNQTNSYNFKTIN